MAMLYDVLARPIVIEAGVNDVIRVEDAASDGVYSATVAAGTYYFISPLSNASILRAVQDAITDGSLNFGLSLQWETVMFISRVVPEGATPTNNVFLIGHNGSVPAFIRAEDALSTFPLSVIGLPEDTDTEIDEVGETISMSSDFLWYSPQPVHTLDEAPSRVDVLEMETPSGRSFRVKHSEVKRFRPLILRNVRRSLMLKEAAVSPPHALETFWERSLTERFRLYRPTLNMYPALFHVVDADLVGTYTYTGASLTGFRFRRSRSQRLPLYDIDLDLREVVP
jgi:phosphatidylserine decarboxylase